MLETPGRHLPQPAAEQRVMTESNLSKKLNGATPGRGSINKELATMKSRKTVRIDWKAVGHRLRVMRITLGISEAEAAAHCVTLATYRKWEAGGKPQTGSFLDFAAKHSVSLDWLLSGNTHSLSQHLSINRGGKVSILPAITPQERQQLAKFGPTMGRHARYRISPRIA